MQTRFFLFYYDTVLVIPKNSYAFLMDTNFKFIRLVDKKTYTEFIEKYPEKEILFKLEPKLPLLTYWHEIPELHPRSMDTRIPKTKEDRVGFQKKYDLELPWDGELQAERQFFVRINEESLEFLVLNLNNLTECYGDSTKGIETEIIGGAKNCIISKKIYSNSDQKVMDDLGRLFSVRGRFGINSHFTCYISSHDELVTLIEKALNKPLSKKEIGSLHEYSIWTRGDIWK